MNLKAVLEGILFIVGDEGTTIEEMASILSVNNDDVKQYVNKLEMFPSNIIASMFHFEKMNFFEVDEASKEVPKVQF